MRNQIMSLVVESGMDEDCYVEMLDYTIELFETQGLGSDYYGYHNINHELEVTYVSLLSANLNITKKFSDNDLKYLYVAALFHDFDPQKSVDKPHEESVLRFISTDKRLRKLLDIANLDLEIIKVLILRTTYPWSGEIKEKAELQIK
ncbi:MAG: HD domain-containing protein, partial [Nitrosarchaeum sp.]|nr:HD domain-containing protein [Nitrosarchaeum sp.]